MLLVAFVPSAWSQAFPEPGKAVTLIVPFPTGGGADFLGRLVAEKLGTLWSTSVVVVNRPGADALIGAQTLASSKKDGYTFGMVTNDFVLNRLTKEPLQYDATKDFTPLGMIADTPWIFVTNPASKVATFQDLVNLSKRDPKSLHYGSCCNWITLQVERVKALSGIAGEVVPYKGSGPNIIGLMGNETAYTMETPVSAGEFIKTGKLAALAVTSTSRLKSFPNVPTLGELGMPKDLEIASWYGLMLPSGVPPEIVAKYTDALKQIMAMPDVQQKIEGRSVRVAPSTAAEMTLAMDNEYKVLQDVMRRAKISFK